MHLKKSRHNNSKTSQLSPLSSLPAPEAFTAKADIAPALALSIHHKCGLHLQFNFNSRFLRENKINLTKYFQEYYQPIPEVNGHEMQLQWHRVSVTYLVTSLNTTIFLIKYDAFDKTFLDAAVAQLNHATICLIINEKEMSKFVSSKKWTWSKP